MESKFKVIDENNIEREATLVTVFEAFNKQYAIYFIDRDNANVNIFVSLIVKDENGNDVLQDITDLEEKEKVSAIVREIIKLPL